VEKDRGEETVRALLSFTNSSESITITSTRLLFQFQELSTK
jgi:hypothetical protein